MPQKILVVDDEENIRDLASLYLQKEGYEVDAACDGTEALKKVGSAHPAMIVLDVMMPGMDGFQVCREVRREHDIPILMLTARSEDVDKIVGLELGADDYMTKPFNPRELVARVKAILRRAESGQRERGGPLVAGNLAVDKSRREVRVGEEKRDLRTKEFDLLVAFMENQGFVLSREQLLESVWGFDHPGATRTVDVHVQHLRSKLEGANVQIETLRGIGYKLVTQPDA